ncbi:MAG: helix-turn-helix transcriptional regulator [Rhizomicrobium sp.]
MSLDDGLSKFIGGLYEAVHEPGAWRGAMAEVIGRSESRLVVVTTADLRDKDIVHTRFHGREDSSVETGEREYVHAMSAVDPAFDWIQQNPGAGVCESGAVLAESDYGDHEFVKWCRSRLGTSHWNVFYTEPVDDLSFVVTFLGPAEAGRSRRDHLALQALLFENLERAVRLAARPPSFADDESALITIDSLGRPLSLSQRAEDILRNSKGLAISGGLLTARRPEDNRLLRRAIRAAVDPSSGERPGRGVRINGPDGKFDILVVVSRFPRWLDHLPPPVPAALVRLIQLEMGPEHLSEHSHMFGFSLRETNVASALLEGHSIDSLAAALGISRNTARNHVQALFRKTHTSRQVDLVRVLDRLARH